MTEFEVGVSCAGVVAGVDVAGVDVAGAGDPGTEMSPMPVIPSTTAEFFCCSLILCISLEYEQSGMGLWAGVVVGVPGVRLGWIPAERLGCRYCPAPPRPDAPSLSRLT